MQPPKLLYVSDDPEKFVGHGRLFSAKLPADGSTARVLFDHLNLAAAPMGVIVALANVGPNAATVATSGACAGPGDAQLAGGGSIDAHNGMEVGHTATAGFMKKRYLSGDGGITQTTLAPNGAPLVLCSRVLAPPPAGQQKANGECVAGIFDVYVETGGADVELRVMACDPGQRRLRLGCARQRREPAAGVPQRRLHDPG